MHRYRQSRAKVACIVQASHENTGTPIGTPIGVRSHENTGTPIADETALAEHCDRATFKHRVGRVDETDGPEREGVVAARGFGIIEVESSGVRMASFSSANTGVDPPAWP